MTPGDTQPSVIMLLLWFALVPVACCKLAEPQLDPGAFSPTTNWILQHTRNQHLAKGDNSSQASNTRRNEERSPCGCSCGQPVTEAHGSTPSTPSAVISTVPTYLTLTCETPHPYEFISWWLFKCPENRNILQVTSGPFVLIDGFEVFTGRSEKGYFSSLLIKDVTSSISSGLYQCVSHAPSTSQHPFFSRTDYFVIGKRITMRDCLFDALSRNEFKRQIENKLVGENHRQPRIDDIDSSSVLSFDFSDAIAYPVLQNALETDLKPPDAQQSSDIPIQVNSYVRFDFTGGQKVQNRELS